MHQGVYLPAFGTLIFGREARQLGQNSRWDMESVAPLFAHFQFQFCSEWRSQELVC